MLCSLQSARFDLFSVGNLKFNPDDDDDNDDDDGYLDVCGVAKLDNVEASIG